jgi:hypothetical protein
MSPDFETMHWELHPPPGDSQPAWLAELSVMRGQILYDQGRRPSFRLPDGSYADVDPLDAFAYHLLARTPTGIAGCVRLICLGSALTCVTESLLGPALFEELLRVLETPRERMSEPSRWMVQHDYRKTGLAMQVAAGIWAVAGWLGHQRCIAMVGIHEGRDRMFLAVGAKPVPGVPVLSSSRFADEMRCLYCDVAHPAGAFATTVEEMGLILGLHREGTLAILELHTQAEANRTGTNPSRSRTIPSAGFRPDPCIRDVGAVSSQSDIVSPARKRVVNDLQ